MVFVSLVIPVRLNNLGEIELWGQIRKTKDELYNNWEFPGGKIEENELPLAAAMREIKEEVNVSLVKSDLTLAFIYPSSKVQFYVFFTQKIFPVTLGEYKPFSLVLESNIPPINKEFLRKYQLAFDKYLTY